MKLTRRGLLGALGAGLAALGFVRRAGGSDVPRSDAVIPMPDCRPPRREITWDRGPHPFFDSPCRYNDVRCVRALKDPVCGYDGAEKWCDKTLERCRALGNEGRFCEFPGTRFVRLDVSTVIGVDVADTPSF